MPKRRDFLASRAILRSTRAGDLQFARSILNDNGGSWNLILC